jgi:hypothetical protein
MHMSKHRLAIAIVRPVQEHETSWFAESTGSVLDDERSAEVFLYALRYAAPVRALATDILIEIERPRFC